MILPVGHDINCAQKLALATTHAANMHSLQNTAAGMLETHIM